MKKGFLNTQVIFYILMGIIFVGILLFGIDRLSGLDEQVSEQEKLEIKLDMQDVFEFCEDPLNKGSKRTLEFQHNGFDIVCIIGEDIRDASDFDADCSTTPYNPHCANLESLYAPPDLTTYSDVYTVASTYSDDETPVILLKGTYEETIATSAEVAAGIAASGDTITRLTGGQVVDHFNIRLRNTQQDTVCWYAADSNFEKVRISAVC